jgi:hypothetical protein
MKWTLKLVAEAVQGTPMEHEIAAVRQGGRLSWRAFARVGSGICQLGAQPDNEDRQTFSEVGGSPRCFFIEQAH